jgi:hypothetical protein
METNIFKRRYLLTFVLAIMSLSCGNDDSEPVVPVEEKQVPDTTENTACTTLSLVTESVFPVDKILINGIADDLKNDITAEFWYEGEFMELSMNVGTDDEGESFILAPIHPILPLKGGELQVIFKSGDESIICEPLSFTINELPEANGYTKEVAEGLQMLLKQRTDYLGMEQTVLAGNFEELEPTELPFALIYNLLNNKDSEISLFPLLENDALLTDDSLDKETSIDFANRLLKKYGVLDYVNQRANDFETGISGKSNLKSIVKKDSASCDGVNAEDLAFQMKAAADTEYSNPDTITGKYFEDLSNLATGAGFAGGKVGKAAAILGATVFAIQKLEEGYSKTRLSHFTDFEFEITTDFIEETACREPILEADVYAASDSWSIEKTLWESLLQLSSIASLNVKGAAYEGALEEFGFSLSMWFSSTQLQNLAALGYWKDDLFTIDPITCGPIDVAGSKYLYGSTGETAFKVSDSTALLIVFPIAPGEDTLEVGLRPEFFAQQTIARSKDLTLTPIELNWEPNVEVLTITPGENFYLELHLNNTENLNLNVTTEEGFLRPGEGVSLDTIQGYILETPSNLDRYPFTVSAEFKSTECFRVTEYAEPVIASIIIDIPKGIEVYTNNINCITSGDYIDFDVYTTHQNEAVEWSVQNESGNNLSISQDGGFTAPTQAGKYYITATLESTPEISDTLEIEVAESCICFWNFTGGSFAMAYDQAWYTINGNMANGAIQFNLHNEFYTAGDEEMVIGMDISFLPEIGKEKVTLGVNDLDFGSNLINITGLFPSGYVGGPLGDYTVTLTRKYGYLEGTITGTLENATDESEFEFVLKFGANEGLLSCE